MLQHYITDKVAYRRIKSETSVTLSESFVSNSFEEDVDDESCNDVEHFGDDVEEYSDVLDENYNEDDVSNYEDDVEYDDVTHEAECSREISYDNVEDGTLECFNVELAEDLLQDEFIEVPVVFEDYCQVSGIIECIIEDVVN